MSSRAGASPQLELVRGARFEHRLYVDRNVGQKVVSRVLFDTIDGRRELCPRAPRHAALVRHFDRECGRRSVDVSSALAAPELYDDLERRPRNRYAVPDLRSVLVVDTSGDDVERD